MQIPWPNVDMIVMAVALAAVAVFVRFLSVFGILYPLRAGHRVSLLSTINLSQISEFSLVILTLGIGFGHIPKETVTPVIWVFAILAVASTYAIHYSHPLQGAVSRLLTRAGLKDVGGGEEEPEGEAARPVVVLGFFRNASAFLDEAARKAPHLMKKIEVIDLTPWSGKGLREWESLVSTVTSATWTRFTMRESITPGWLSARFPTAFSREPAISACCVSSRGCVRKQLLS